MDKREISRVVGLVGSLLGFLLGILFLVAPSFIVISKLVMPILLIGLIGMIQMYQYIAYDKWDTSKWLFSEGFILFCLAVFLSIESTHNRIVDIAFLLAFCGFVNGFHQFLINHRHKKMLRKNSIWLVCGGTVSLLVGIGFCACPLLLEFLSYYAYVIYLMAASFWQLCYSMEKMQGRKGDGSS